VPRTLLSVARWQGRIVVTDERKRVLIVDDSADDIHVLMENLKQDYAVLAATSGEKALLLASKKPQPDIILMDVMMPDMNGYETCRCLKENPETRNIDVIFVSANDSADEKIVGYEAGGCDYLIKPVQAGELLQKIKLAIKNQEVLEDSAQTHEQLEEAQGQLLQSEKMAAIGQLAAGVAHEINNPVGYINSNISSLRGYVQDLFRVLDAYAQMETSVADTDQSLLQLRAIKQEVDFDYLKQDIVDLIRESQEGVDRVRKIVQDLKDFSHVDEVEWQWADLHKGMDSTLNIVHNELKYKAEVVKEYGELPKVECIASQINQIVMNLLVNAAHAIEERGTIRISTGVEGENWIWISIGDDGKGIEQKNLKKIFNPFFTTKPVGKGTGLGLSLAYSIIEKHHGKISVESEPGNTVFTIRLPVKHVDEQAEAELGTGI